MPYQFEKKPTMTKKSNLESMKNGSRLIVRKHCGQNEEKKRWFFSTKISGVFYSSPKATSYRLLNLWFSNSADRVELKWAPFFHPEIYALQLNCAFSAKCYVLRKNVKFSKAILLFYQHHFHKFNPEKQNVPRQRLQIRERIPTIS